MTESFENFLLMIEPAKRQRLLCLGDVRQISRLSSEYQECHFCRQIDDLATLKRFEGGFDLVCVPHGEKAMKKVAGRHTVSSLLSRLCELLADGGRLVVGFDGRSLKIMTHLAFIRYGIRRSPKNFRSMQVHAAYPSGANPHLSGCWERQSLQWFFSHLKPPPGSGYKKFLYWSCSMLGLNWLLIPGFLVEIEK